ncbi:Holliday junction branch migration protein RuvA [Candidatus Parcubacteria bacterium]|nr:Holliday junction branch migration protein RuvA [Candidatus Parcubacteria bacterium]
MISTISGTVRHKDLHVVVVDVNGVGYKIFCTTDTALDALPGESILLWTYLSVRENALDLFGFLDKETLDTFELLIGISGIGPKTALGILNVASPSMLRQAVATEDTSYLTKVSGIGRKNAEKIVLELKDKLVTTSADIDKSMKGAGDVMEALLSLGYDERDVREVIKKIPKEAESAAERVKAALKLLSQHG